MNREINIGGNQFLNFKSKLGIFFLEKSQGMKLVRGSFTGGSDARHYNNTVKDKIREFKK